MIGERPLKYLIIILIMYTCESDSSHRDVYKNSKGITSLNTPLSNYNCSTSSAKWRFRRSYSPVNEPLHCPPCEQIHCYKQRRKRLRCKGGFTLGVCGCCKVCAKLVGEQCGGQHDYLGKCDAGLTCELQEPKSVTVLRNGIKTVYKVESGICKKGATIEFKSNEVCKPKCDAEYCLKNPKGTCSAMDNVERLQRCQGHCQHTSCRACKFISPDQQCPRCSKDDFKCIREFGRCIRKKSCLPKSYPCGNSVMNRKAEDLFKCQVPECPLSN